MLAGMAEGRLTAGDLKPGVSFTSVSVGTTLTISGAPGGVTVNGVPLAPPGNRRVERRHPTDQRSARSAQVKFGRRLTVALLSVGVLALAACGSDNSSASSAPTTANSPGSAAKVERTTWELSLDSVNVPDLAHARPTMRLVGGTASGSTGCNLYTGPYTISAQRLTFGVLAQTNIACGPEETAIESAFVPRLGMTATYTLNGDQLQLHDSGGATLLTFNPANTSLQGSWTVLGYLRADASAFTSVVLGSNVTANFGADGTFSGNTGCNNLNGLWKQGNRQAEAVSIGPLATTLAACTSADLSEQEHSYVAALQASVRAEVTSTSAALLTAPAYARSS